ncbi:hypothetical protein ACFFKU_09195 [Kineococcus gynurae]|uniref:Secreted protein n=1 Tax=Kineococcus gynurae TaxID=452979 RepID=A0ABV5LVR8_9ACTN
MTTLIVTFVLVVGLALAVLYSVAAPPLRERGSSVIARVDHAIGRAAAWGGRQGRHLRRAGSSTERTEARETLHQH